MLGDGKLTHRSFPSCLVEAVLIVFMQIRLSLSVFHSRFASNFVPFNRFVLISASSFVFLLVSSPSNIVTKLIN
jgi:hypothetical protein